LRPYLAEMRRRAHLPPNTELLLFEVSNWWWILNRCLEIYTVI
jgi:hypothetical protein